MTSPPVNEAYAKMLAERQHTMRAQGKDKQWALLWSEGGSTESEPTEAGYADDGARCGSSNACGQGRETGRVLGEAKSMEMVDGKLEVGETRGRKTERDEVRGSAVPRPLDVRKGIVKK